MSGGIAYSGRAEAVGNGFNECLMVKAAAARGTCCAGSRPTA